MTAAWESSKKLQPCQTTAKLRRRGPTVFVHLVWNVCGRCFERILANSSSATYWAVGPVHVACLSAGVLRCQWTYACVGVEISWLKTPFRLNRYPQSVWNNKWSRFSFRLCSDKYEHRQTHCASVDANFAFLVEVSTIVSSSPAVRRCPKRISSACTINFTVLASTMGYSRVPSSLQQIKASGSWA